MKALYLMVTFDDHWLSIGPCCGLDGDGEGDAEGVGDALLEGLSVTWAACGELMKESPTGHIAIASATNETANNVGLTLRHLPWSLASVAPFGNAGQRPIATHELQ